MLLSCDFDVVGHLDLVRKFNTRHPYFDETAPWYLAELDRTADAVSASGKIAEVRNMKNSTLRRSGVMSSLPLTAKVVLVLRPWTSVEL